MIILFSYINVNNVLASSWLKLYLVMKMNIGQSGIEVIKIDMVVQYSGGEWERAWAGIDIIPAEDDNVRGQALIFRRVSAHTHTRSHSQHLPIWRAIYVEIE